MAGPTAPTTAPTAIRAGGPLLSPVRRNIIFTALVFGVLVAATGQTIVVPALPTIVAELGSTVDQSWRSPAICWGELSWLWWLASSVICSAATGCC